MTNSRRHYLGAALLTSMLITTFGRHANAETVISKSYKYFNIGGQTPEALDRELSRRGPRSMHSGERHPGLTQIKFTYELTYSQSKTKCSIAKTKVNLSTRIILPRWRYRNKADANLRFIWDTLYADIKRHEDRHAEIARQHARKMDKALARIPSARTCDALEEKADRVASKEIAAHDKDQLRFDKLESAHFEQRMIRLLKNRSKHVFSE